MPMTYADTDFAVSTTACDDQFRDEPPADPPRAAHAATEVGAEPARTGRHTNDTDRAYRMGAGIALLTCAACVALSILSVVVQALQK